MKQPNPTPEQVFQFHSSLSFTSFLFPGGVANYVKIEHILTIKLKILSCKEKFRVQQWHRQSKKTFQHLVLLASLLLSIAVPLVHSIGWMCITLHYNKLYTYLAINYHIESRDQSCKVEIQNLNCVLLIVPGLIQMDCSR